MAAFNQNELDNGLENVERAVKKELDRLGSLADKTRAAVIDATQAYVKKLKADADLYIKGEIKDEKIIKRLMTSATFAYKTKLEMILGMAEISSAKIAQSIFEKVLSEIIFIILKLLLKSIIPGA